MMTSEIAQPITLPLPSPTMKETDPLLKALAATATATAPKPIIQTVPITDPAAVHQKVAALLVFSGR
jgi:hypothetical protein